MTDVSVPERRPWNPTRRTRILIGIATIWPPVYFILFLAFVGLEFFWAGPHAPAGREHLDLFKYIFPVHCLTMLLNFALMAVYVVHAVKNGAFTQEMRIIWILILFFGNLFAFPVYWWLYLRPGAPSALPSRRSVETR